MITEISSCGTVSGQDTEAAPHALLEPKLFGWCYQVRDEILRELRKNDWMNLTELEADRLSVNLVDHIISHLRALRVGWGIWEAWKPGPIVSEIAQRLESGMQLTETQANIVGARDLIALVEAIAEGLEVQQGRLARLNSPELTFERVFTRDIHSSSFFIDRLAYRWRTLGPARQFMLLGGEEALNRIFGGKVPPKFEKKAIFAISLRGSFTSRLPNPDVLPEFPALSITDDQVQKGREFALVIPAHPALQDPTNYLFPGKDRAVRILLRGLHPKPSMRGKIKGTNAGGEVPDVEMGMP